MKTPSQPAGKPETRAAERKPWLAPAVATVVPVGQTLKGMSQVNIS